MVWKPHVTVAAVIEKDSRFLLVEEQTTSGLAFNQPAGHLEENEDIINAVKREVLEETAWQFEPEHLVGIQLWKKSPEYPTFLRFSFCGQVHSHRPELALDDGIIATHWLTRDQIAQRSDKLRSPLVLEVVDDYLNNKTYPLSILKSLI